MKETFYFQHDSNARNERLQRIGSPVNPERLCESEFQEGIAEATGKAVHIAEPDMTINFDKTPF